MSESLEKQKLKPNKRKVEMTEVEWEIMRIVWDKEPCAAGTVQEELARLKKLHSGSPGKAYSTIKTTMDRMVEKGFLQIEKVRNLQLFKSCISEVDAKHREFRKMLKRAFDGALTPMMQFLIEHEGISKDEASQLRELVQRSEEKSEK
ncbi:MAG: BlaI/MecI/CopY family transcriptional regulator [Sedimentisphaerales bacterium]|nr:BlaI/MecI/CopY family transcriptional regulator [Sedimentisphaerales bacterium]